MPVAEMDVAASQAHCRRVAQRAARNFYYAFLPLSREQHNAMCAVYAFARYSDDVSDDERSGGIEARRAALARWRGSLEAALAGRFGDSPILPALAQAAEHFHIPPRYFFELLEGVETDLDPPRYRTFDDLYHYCYLVASTIGLVCLHIFGFKAAEASVYAEKLGVAFQLTNILRDLREDTGRGRLYLPEEDLARFGAERADIEAGRLDKLRELLRFEAGRAEAYYCEAAPLLGLIDRRSRASLWVMTAIYHGILERLRRSGYDVFSRRAGLSGAEKTGILLRGLKLHLVGGNVSFPA
ncbi:MAG TPA: phytoene/squalene synthase family protein [Bryobacterales bacterium]|nr:phytoene/squalene synthase family protein [Bryobacterales bacterium]